MSKAKLFLNQWKDAQEDFCRRIASTKGTLKILLKTKDDYHFLESWIEHHAKIVGLNHLIIFDNMSSNEKVTAIYEKYQSHVPIIRFDSYHNRLHIRDEYPELYDCLKESCEFFIFLDTDEFLVLIDNDTYVCDETILDFLDRYAGANVLPASWLHNLAGCDKRFKLGESLLELAHGLCWGKPILRSRANLRGYLNHNIQLDKAMFHDEVITNFFVLHMRYLFAQQRIETNINKLRSTGFATLEDNVESILARKIPDTNEGNIQIYVQELKELVKLSNSSSANAKPLGEGCIELGSGGRISYYSDTESNVLNTFLSGPSKFASAVLKVHATEVTSTWDQLKSKWKQLAEYDQLVFNIKRIALLQLPSGSKVAVVSKGDTRLTEIPGRSASHFPQDSTGEFLGFFPADGAEAIKRLDTACATGIEFLIFPQTALWWLEYYRGLNDHLNSISKIIFRSAECIIYQFSKADKESTCIS